MCAVCLRQQEWPHGKDVGTFLTALKYSAQIEHFNNADMSKINGLDAWNEVESRESLPETWFLCRRI